MSFPATLRSRRTLHRLKEKPVEVFLALCTWVSVLTMAAMVVVLVHESMPFFEHVGIWEFLAGTNWAPLLEPRSFGVLPLICGTLLVAAGAAIIAIPLGMGSAVFLSEYAPSWLRSILKPVLEVLAGIPTVVYGYFALTFITPFLQKLLPATQVFNAASGAFAVGIMILPMIASLCDDAFHAVPQPLRNAGYAMGATKFEVSSRIVVPAALSGVLASFVLAVSRAIGETMIVAIACGATPRMTLNPLESVQTMTGYIVNVSMGDTPHGTVEYQSIFAVGLLLFAITLLMNVVSHYALRRFREVYE
jgi:phosphate transport system permease protein